jgi:hypothetical protein
VLSVYVDDATSRIMELHFAESESTFDYFEATRHYIEGHGKPMALYSDRHSVFHIAEKPRSGRGAGLSQFGRALGEINIDIICANSAEAKGRVERAHLTLQDRLVKELRLRGLSTMEDAESYLKEFTEDYNKRFSRPAKNTHDAHRPLNSSEDLDQVFTIQETRRITNNLTVNYKRGVYLIEDTEETRRLRGATATVHERMDGSVTIKCADAILNYRVHQKETARISQGSIVENKRLGAAFELIAVQQKQRDAKKLANPKVTLREKKRIRAEAQVG